MADSLRATTSSFSPAIYLDKSSILLFSRSSRSADSVTNAANVFITSTTDDSIPGREHGSFTSESASPRTADLVGGMAEVTQRYWLPT